MSLTLHFHPLSSFCWKALIALYENGTPFTPKLVDLGNPAERAALVKLWGIGKFPVLTDDGSGEAVPESSVIIEYLDRHYPGRTKFIPDEPGVALQTRLRDRFYDSYVHLPMGEDHGRPAVSSGRQQDPHRRRGRRRRQLGTSYAMIEQQMAGLHGRWEPISASPIAPRAGAVLRQHGGAARRDQQEPRRLFRAPEGAAVLARVIGEAEPYFNMVPKERLAGRPPLVRRLAIGPAITFEIISSRHSCQKPVRLADERTQLGGGGDQTEPDDAIHGDCERPAGSRKPA